MRFSRNIPPGGLVELLPVKRTEKKLKVFPTARQVCRAVGTEDLGTLLRQATQIFGFCQAAR